MNEIPKLTPQVVRWAAEECERQQSGELSVSWMIDAWEYARQSKIKYPNVLLLLEVENIAQFVEPVKNSGGTRTRVVTIDYRPIPWENIETALCNLLQNLPPLPEIDEAIAVEAYRAFEELHPFIDGNGRTGALIYNIIRGSLAAPVSPPNLWGK